MEYYDEDSQQHYQGIQKLPQDFDRPASPTDDEEVINAAHPQTDANLDAHELYDEGLAGAAELSERNESAVLSYDPTRVKPATT